MLKTDSFGLPLETIDLSFEEIFDDDMLLLCKFISESVTVKKLKLEEAGIGDNERVIFELGQSLKINKSVEVLNLSKNHITGQGLQVMLNGFTVSRKLEDASLLGKNLIMVICNIQEQLSSLLFSMKRLHSIYETSFL